MSWLAVHSLNWQSPLSLAAHFRERDMALLYSGMQEATSGRYSYLCIDPLEIAEGATLDQLPTTTHNSILPDWVGYLGYGLRENQPISNQSPITLPNLCFIRYRYLFHFDHQTETLSCYSRDGSTLDIPASTITTPQLSIAGIDSNFTRAIYESSIAATIDRIHAGDFYQANITRKFFGHFTETPDSWHLFTKLCEASPAPYSAYIRHEGSAILSASPECFLSIDTQGQITSRPIKGSARTSADPAEDASIRESLQSSAKNNAENLMITDLMRNDLARISIPESVQVTEQSALYSYATIHHLISTIRAQKRDDTSLTDIIRACFPPGSMTGAPKIAAMRWCAEQERVERGVYSGAIGWLGANGSCDLSVVIRTLIIEGKNFEFQVGGGIVADSTPEDEWRETLTKARGICTALGISEEILANL